MASTVTLPVARAHVYVCAYCPLVLTVAGLGQWMCALFSVILVAELYFHFRLPTSAACLEWHVPTRGWGQGGGAFSAASLQAEDATQSRPNSQPGNTVLVLTPVKDAVRYLDRYFANLYNLTYPRHLLSLALLDDDESRNGSTWRRCVAEIVARGRARCFRCCCCWPQLTGHAAVAFPVFSCYFLVVCFLVTSGSVRS